MAYRVFVVDSAGIAHARAVTVGGRTESLAEILTGLAAGETVVTTGAYGVQDSARSAARAGEALRHPESPATTRLSLVACSAPPDLEGVAAPVRHLPGLQFLAHHRGRPGVHVWRAPGRLQYYAGRSRRP